MNPRAIAEIAAIGLAVATAALIAATCTTPRADAAPFVLYDGAQKVADCGDLRQNARGIWVWRTANPEPPFCVPIGSPTPAPTPAATRSPNWRPSPTKEPDPCPGGCMVWNPVTDTTRCVRPCP